VSRLVVPGFLLLLAMAMVVARSAQTTSPFIAYLQGDRQGDRPAFVAFNPSGFDPRTPPAGAYPAAELRADLAALRPAFDGLVLYGFNAALTPGILEQGAALGYRAVLLGIWDPKSDAEVAGVAELVRRYRDQLALAVCIGNEGINDNRYTIEDAERAGDRLRALVGADVAVPVTTSEPAGDYGWPPLRGFGDFLAPNIHPAIDQEALSPTSAVAWVRGRAEAIAQLSGKPVLVKESGVPNGGGAPHSLERQRGFWAEWLARGRLMPTNQTGPFVSFAGAFEAFDAPWKAVQLENPSEGHWGLMTADRQPYPAFQAWVEAAGR
jgi:exo-beta-1,3-glucanase (GH17 family)